MNLFDPPISSGADTFLWILVLGIAFAVAIATGDMISENRKNKPSDSEH